MSNLGLGVMIKSLGGNNETVEAFRSSLNKTIKKVRLDEENNYLLIEFEDSTKLRIFDDGQSCCEDRYMRTDDNLDDFIDSQLLDAELKDAPNIHDKYGDHEIQFLDIKTSKGVFTMVNHNEHNGYYGGFWIVAKIE